MKGTNSKILQLGVVFAASAWIGTTTLAQDTVAPVDLLELDIATLLTIDITPSADASAKGLSAPDLGGQIAQAGRVGILGSKPNVIAPFSITNYTRSFIQDQQAASVGDVLQYDPSVRVARGFGNFQQLYMVRGLPLFSDDMAYNGLYGILPRQYLAAELVERVEILRGANAFLNGAAPSDSGLGGAVNVMPKRAPLQPLTQLSAGLHSDNEYYLATDLARRSEDGSTGLRLNAAMRNGDSTVNGETKELEMITLGLDHKTGNLRLSVDLGFQSQELDATQPSITIGNGLAIPKAPDADISIAPGWTYADELDWFGTLRAEYDFSESLTLWLAGGARESEEQSRLAAFLTVNDMNGDYNANRFDVVHEDSVATGELGLRFHFVTGNIHHRATFAATYFRNNAHNAFAVFDSISGNIYNAEDIAIPETLTFGGGDLDNPQVTLTTHTQSYALADEFGLLDEQLLITLGLRRQSIHDKNYDYNSGALLDHYDGNQTTPMLAASYKFNNGYSVYANYIEGLTKGGEAPASNSNGPVSNAGKVLEPQQVRQKEIGMKYSGQKLGTSISLFQLDKPILGFNSNNAFTDITTQQHRGLEWLMFGNIATNLRALGGISLLDTDLDGNHSIGAPKKQANLNLDWNLPTLQQLMLNGHVMYTGSQYADAANQQQVPSWWRLDIGLRYSTALWQNTQGIFRLRMENVTNRSYWASAGGYPGAGYLTLGSPRTVQGTLSIDF